MTVRFPGDSLYDALLAQFDQDRRDGNLEPLFDLLDQLPKDEVHAYLGGDALGDAMDRYAIYRACADDGNGGDVTRGGAPLLTYRQWLAA